MLLGLADDALRLDLRRALEACGLAVSEAGELEELLEAVERCDPDVVVAGALAPDAEAHRVCAILNGRSKDRRRPVIALTEADAPHAIQRAFDAGADDFAARPVDPHQLAHRVRFVLRAAAAHERPAASGDQRELASLADIEALIAELRVAMVRATESARRTAVLCVELSRWKQLTAGADQGASDRLMLDVARRLRVGIREDDLLARLGCAASELRLARLRGDEFCVLLRDVEPTADVAKVGQRILDLLAEPFELAGRETFVGASVGVACFPDERLSAEELVKAAEQAAYCAKQDRHGNLLVYSADMDAVATKRLALESHLRRALERNELELFYQPRVDIKSGRIVGAEALVRWNHPELGRVSPLDFIPLAEETGLIVPIGEWILATACKQNRAWQSAGLPPIRVSVNLSAVQFRQRDLYEVVTRTLRASGLDPRWLEFEITESLLMKDVEAAIALLERFQALGLHLSIDDFGTGYSSLSYLKRLPIDAIKIDQSFVREMTTSADDSAMVTAIILMCRSLKVSVVAEGVETKSQLALLRILQCDEIQGYLVSRPVPAAEFAAQLVSAAPAAFAA